MEEEQQPFWRVEQCAASDLESSLNALDVDGFDVHSIHAVSQHRFVVAAYRRMVPLGRIRKLPFGGGLVGVPLIP